MTETELLSSALSAVNQPVIAVRKALIVYMNPPAAELAGKDMTGTPASLLLPSHIINTQADRFVSIAAIGGKSCSVSVSSAGSHKIYSFEYSKPTLDPGTVILSELRSSLANIKFASGCISTMAEDSGDIKLLDHVATLNRNYHRLKRSMDNISTVNALSRGEYPFSPTMFDLVQVFAELIELVGAMAKELEVRIHFHTEEHMYIHADRNAIEQLLFNLLSNSLSHCRRGGHIDVSLLRTGHSIIISVDDDGSGISPEKLSGILTSYTRSSELFRASEGIGLGLTIAGGIAELHGGTLIIESRGVDKGTSVRAMISERTEVSTPLKQSSPDYEGTLDICLTQLSTALPISCYTCLFDD